MTSHFRPVLIGSFLTHPRWNDPEWLDNSFNTYVRLAPGTAPTSLEAKFPESIRAAVADPVKSLRYE